MAPTSEEKRRLMDRALEDMRENYHSIHQRRSDAAAATAYGVALIAEKLDRVIELLEERNGR